MTKTIEIGKQTYVQCCSKLTYLQVLPDIFDFPLIADINQHLLVYPELEQIAQKKYKDKYAHIIEKQRFLDSLFRQAKIELFNAVYPIKGKKYAMSEMQRIYLKYRKANWGQFPRFMLLDQDIKDMFYTFLFHTKLRDYQPSVEDLSLARIKCMYLIPALYDMQEKELIEATSEQLEREKNKKKENKDVR